MRITHRPLAAAAATLALALGLTACSSEEATDSDPASSEVAENEFDGRFDQGITVDSIVGLEVTAVGNVSEVLSTEALRVDRDGLGSEDDALTEYDEDFGDDDAVEEGVLVVGAEDVLSERSVDEEVEVSGTIRRYSQDVLESLYDIDIPGEAVDDVGDTLVVVADSVRPAEDRGTAPAGSGSGSSPSPSADSRG